MNKKFTKRLTDSLVFRFSVLIAVCGAVILLAFGLYVRFAGKAVINDSAKETLTNVSEQISEELENSDTDIAGYIGFMLDEGSETAIRADSSGYGKEKHEFETAFALQYPGMVFGTNIEFDELPPELKELFIRYYSKFLTVRFEQFRRSFGLADVGFIIPDADGKSIVQIISTQHSDTNASKGTLRRSPEKTEASPEVLSGLSAASAHGMAFTGAGESGKENTAVCYKPIVINGRTIGYISASIVVPEQNVWQLILTITALGVIIAASGYAAMHYINRNYFARLRQLSESIEEYTRIKDVDIAERIRLENKGDDEISVVSQQTASMMSELHKHIDRIMMISGELLTANERAEKFSELALKDAMTGLDNKLSYYEAAARLDEQIESGSAQFAILIIDLNFLKKINDEFGHNHGDIMIRKLADMISDFFRDCGKYRIGGDEFAVILEGDNARNALTLTASFRNLISAGSSAGYWEYPSAAVGCSNYRAGSDHSVKEVFDRADNEMYGNKVQMKAGRRD